VLVPRVSVTTTADEKGVANVEGKLTLVPRLRFEGAEIESAPGGTLLITVSVKDVVAAYAEIVPMNGEAMMSDKANILYFRESFICEI
jgi:hypothetical protein